MQLIKKFKLCVYILVSFPDTMNFTQLIWRASSDIGVGVAKVKGKDKCVIVAQYRPVGNGNKPGEFRKNVLPPNDS